MNYFTNGAPYVAGYMVCVSQSCFLAEWFASLHWARLWWPFGLTAVRPLSVTFVLPDYLHKCVVDYISQGDLFHVCGITDYSTALSFPRWCTADAKIKSCHNKWTQRTEWCHYEHQKYEWCQKERDRERENYQFCNRNYNISIIII